MSFAQSISRAPLPYYPERGQEVLAGLPSLPGEASTLVSGVAGCSPYLSGLLRKEADWVACLFHEDMDEALSDIFGDLPDPQDPDVGRALRRAKGRVALLAALADCGGVWSLSEVTGALSSFADRAVQIALEAALAPTFHKLSGGAGEFGADLGGLTVLAMGKHGAGELNYSSDIDLICLFDDARYLVADLPAARMVFVKAVRKAMAILSETTADGYVFRTDLRLRPDPSVTPVAVSMAAAERYYESLGRTWERAAYIKARPIAGDIRAASHFLDAIRPFIWRRHLDFPTIEDTRAMQDKIRNQKRLWESGSLDGHDLKLGPGGIRQIEFFVQSHQLLAGGRDPRLRVRGTVPALHRLAEAGWISEAAAERLPELYRRLRTWEHRVQMVQDAQTHALPKDTEGWDRLARFMGMSDTAALRSEIKATFDEVQALTAPAGKPKMTGATAKETPPSEMETVAARWHKLPALRSDSARELLARLLPDLLARFQTAPRPDEGLAQFERFLSGLPAGVQVFSLFEANPQLIDLMVDIASTSPALAQHLGRVPGVLDAVIDGDFFTAWPGRDVLASSLDRTLAEENDYERKLDAARRWHKDWHFRIGVHHLRGLVSAPAVSAQYADLAEATLRGLWPVVQAELALKHGEVPGASAVIVAMGSLGARSLTATSDLDLIIIYDGPSDAMSDGRKALSIGAYFTRLTKALVTALSVQTAEGTLYSVDMRLRPSGRQGPLATSLAAFERYQRQDAWTWEHMALTRARVATGSNELAPRVETVRTEVLAHPHDPTKVMADLADMRARVHEAKRRASLWDVDNGPGGRQDIELLSAAQTLLSACPEQSSLAQLSQSMLADADKDSLIVGHGLMSTIKVVCRLLTGGVIDMDTLGEGGRGMLLRETGHSDIATLESALREAVATAEAVIERATARSD